MHKNKPSSSSSSRIMPRKPFRPCKSIFHKRDKAQQKRAVLQRNSLYKLQVKRKLISQSISKN